VGCQSAHQSIAIGRAWPRPRSVVERLEASAGFEPAVEVLQVGLSGPPRPTPVPPVFGCRQLLSPKVRPSSPHFAGVAVTAAVIAGSQSA
jgi:hypothetical protein